MDKILYFDRYLEREVEEQVYGDAALRWTYQTRLGRLSLALLVKRAWFSRWYGWRMDRPASKNKIEPFIREFGLDADEFALAPEQYETFNEFFYRKLKPESRPIASEANSAVFPADGRHLCVPDLADCEGLFVKGETFELSELLRDEALTERFARGSLLLSRLCPTDYHRFHFPVAGTPGPSRMINGPLYSVNPIALCQNIRILATNKREITVLESERFGNVLLIEVGATCVGGIRQTYSPGDPVAKGEEKGFFRFGGSSTITIFEPGRIRFDEDLVECSRRQQELYARVGDHLGRAV